jgi:hypothetical protein
MHRRLGRGSLYAAMGALGLLVAPRQGAAQNVRVTGVTSMQYVQMRPLERDSLFSSYDPNGAEFRQLADGTPIHCGSTNYCYWYKSLGIATAAPLLQDLSFTSWGMAQGMSIHADVRARTQLITDGFIYPRANDKFDLLDAYAEWQRSWGRARLGRQWVNGGLGTYDFDGVSALVRRDRWSYEGWAGRALVGGINDTHASGVLAAVENFPPDQDGWILGARTRFRSSQGSTLAAMYQRVVVNDRSGVYSERAAVDASARIAKLSVDAAFAYDFATGAWNEGRVRLSSDRTRAVSVSAEIKHYVPFFELWTIWGAFSPVGYNEARSTIDWRPAGSHWSLSTHGAYRKYEETNAGLTLSTNGWRAGADLSWVGAGAFSALGTYDVAIGNGASRSDGSASFRWNRGDDFSAGIDLTALQTIYEFRVGTGRVMGAAFNLSKRLFDDLSVSGDIGLYRHIQMLGAPGPDWNQKRASLRLEWSVGRDPGAPAANKAVKP